MNKNGFSLTEVLVSLLLMTGTSLALLHQQWQLNQSINQFQLHQQALNELDNTSEQLLAGDRLSNENKKITIKQSQQQHLFILNITWQPPHSRLQTIRRQLVIS